MTNEKLNKAKVSFAQGEKELLNAKANLNQFYDGKIRAIARRASGFYIDGFITLTDREHYGKSFMNHLRGLSKDTSIPKKINNSANELILQIKNEELSGTKAIWHADVIINFCKEKLIEIENEFNK
jgi:uncharacterized protein (UPF0147 family)